MTTIPYPLVVWTGENYRIVRLSPTDIKLEELAGHDLCGNARWYVMEELDSSQLDTLLDELSPALHIPVLWNGEETANAR